MVWDPVTWGSKLSAVESLDLFRYKWEEAVDRLLSEKASQIEINFLLSHIPIWLISWVQWKLHLHILL